MKKLINIIFLTLLLSVFGVSAFAQGDGNKKGNSKINVNFNKSKNLTTVRLKQFTITNIGQEKVIANNVPLHQMDLEISFSYPGQEISKPAENVNLRFHAVAGNYIFLKGQQVIGVLDRDTPGQDRALSLGFTDYKSVAPKFNSIYEEYLSIDIPSSAFAKMAKANSLELFLGPVGYRLTDDQKNSVVDLAAMMSSSTK